MDELIRHEGIVLSTNDKMAHIEIVQSSACSACKAKAMCSSSESQAKEMDALMLEPMVPGDRVEVEVREQLAWKAVLLAYILPLLVMMTTIAALDLLTGWDEPYPYRYVGEEAAHFIMEHGICYEEFYAHYDPDFKY